MSISIRTLCLATAAAASFGAMVAGGAGPAAACDINSATDISCGPISVNPANPLSPLNLSNPANPASPLNPSNPSNPLSPSNPSNSANINNPANPLSPFNPMNQLDVYGAAPGYYDGYDGVGLLSSLLGLDAGPAVTPPDGYEPDNQPAVHHRRHHRHKRGE